MDLLLKSLNFWCTKWPIWPKNGWYWKFVVAVAQIFHLVDSFWISTELDDENVTFSYFSLFDTFFSSAEFGLFTKVSPIGSFFIQILTNFPNFCKKPNQKISKTLALPHIFLIGLHIILPYLRVVRPCSLVVRDERLYTTHHRRNNVSPTFN